MNGPHSPLSEADLLALADRHLLKNYRQPPFVLRRGRGARLEDTERRGYLDFAAGVAVCAVGHAHPTLAAALAEQASKLVHVSNYFYNEENVLLAGELCARTGYARAFFCNSGTEAVEAALKAARRFHFLAGHPHKTRFVAFHNAFHGRTMGALALTGTPKYREGFAPGVEGVTHVASGDLEAVRAAMGPDVAAVFVEPVQGEGGALPAPPGFLAALRALADEHGALLVIDEIQTGIGRTGTFLAHEQDGAATPPSGHAEQGVRADLVPLAKGLGGGVPIGAVLFSERVAPALGPGSHGSTFGGNPLACCAARTVLRILDDEQLLSNAAARGAQLSAGLAKAAHDFSDVAKGERGRGLLRGLVLAQGIEPRAALDFARAEGLLLTAAGADVLRYTPPLVVTEADVAEAIEATRRTLASLRAARGG